LNDTVAIREMKESKRNFDFRQFEAQFNNCFRIPVMVKEYKRQLQVVAKDLQRMDKTKALESYWEVSTSLMHSSAFEIITPPFLRLSETNGGFRTETRYRSQAIQSDDGCKR
jgi:hypothetical protein